MHDRATLDPSKSVLVQIILSANDTMNDITVSILIVSYNTADLTLAAINSVIEETHEVAYEIIVVDNNSTDGSVNAIRSDFPEVQLINLRRNVGFAVANAATRRDGCESQV